ncbi:hypothetical protein [Herbidospora yilanensis]|uniref:hypothetical protein n=1 Tax=Herbidospora yilanensis TaxID=354426 RepID=UPI0018DEC296|nr:hypothetical protein [Herbidospora yilanensis]
MRLLSVLATLSALLLISAPPAQAADPSPTPSATPSATPPPTNPSPTPSLPPTPPPTNPSPTPSAPPPASPSPTPEPPLVATVAPGAVEPASYTGQCHPGKSFVLSAVITADRAGAVGYSWQGMSDGTAFFTEAGSQTVTVTTTHFYGQGRQSATVLLRDGSGLSTVVSYDLNCTDPVPYAPQIQPAADYTGRCGADVVHTATAQITSPIAQTVRYRWTGSSSRDLPGAEGEREIVFTEPGTKTVSTPFQRQPVPSADGTDFVRVQITSPGAYDRLAAPRYYKTVCLTADFTGMTRLTGTCKPATPYKFQLEGYVESNAAGRVQYAWARQTESGGEWYREPWTEISFDVPRRQSVNKTILVGNGESGAVRLEVLGSDGNIVTASRSYRTCNIDL